MFVCLSEIDCLGYLQSKGIYPDEFYTDFELFKSKTVVHQDMDILVIFAGCCFFKKRLVCEFITHLRGRMGRSNDSGVSSVTVLSDSVLPKIDDYYRYSGAPVEFVKYNGWSKVGSAEGVLDRFKDLGKRTTKRFLSQAVMDDIVIGDSEKKVDEMIGIIKIPHIAVR